MTRVEKACLLPLAVLVGVAAWMGAMGCTTSPRYYTEREPDYVADRYLSSDLRYLKPGQRFEWKNPALRRFRVARSQVWFVWVDAYEVQVTSDSGVGPPSRVWLYAYNNTFIRSGPPGEWPNEQEVAQLNQRPDSH